jgi:hypothetical protein|tara:strand:- start:13950 stop:14243 length:294 start_codon:yes stop_codon:yes gene_type:complete
LKSKTKYSKTEISKHRHSKVIAIFFDLTLPKTIGKVFIFKSSKRISLISKGIVMAITNKNVLKKEINICLSITILFSTKVKILVQKAQTKAITKILI